MGKVQKIIGGINTGLTFYSKRNLKSVEKHLYRIRIDPPKQRKIILEDEQFINGELYNDRKFIKQVNR